MFPSHAIIYGPFQSEPKTSLHTTDKLWLSAFHCTVAPATHNLTFLLLGRLLDRWVSACNELNVEILISFPHFLHSHISTFGMCVVSSLLLRFDVFDFLTSTSILVCADVSFLLLSRGMRMIQKIEFLWFIFYFQHRNQFVLCKLLQITGANSWGGYDSNNEMQMRFAFLWPSEIMELKSVQIVFATCEFVNLFNKLFRNLLNISWKH